MIRIRLFLQFETFESLGIIELSLGKEQTPKRTKKNGIVILERIQNREK